MAVRTEEVEIGKSYQVPNGTIRRVYEIIPEQASRRNEISDEDIIRYEAEKWGYDNSQHNGKTRVKLKVREKMKRTDFAREASKRLD